MRLTVSNIPEEGIEEHLNIPLTLKDISLKGNVKVFFKATRFGSRVLVSGIAEAEASVSCSRCLKDVPTLVKTDFSVEYIPDAEMALDAEHELSRQELDVNVYQDDEIKIDDLVREQILLAIPMKSLCRVNCRGICAKCGSDLNVKACQCPEGAPDPRLEPLRKLKSRLEKH